MFFYNYREKETRAVLLSSSGHIFPAKRDWLSERPIFAPISLLHTL